MIDKSVISKSHGASSARAFATRWRSSRPAGKADSACPETAPDVGNGPGGRVGIARSTLQRIESGDSAVAIGRVFEAAVITGVDLFVPEATSLAPEIRRTAEQLALMPGSIRGVRREMDDDF